MPYCKITRILSREKLVKFCISRNFYTSGSCVEYEKMLSMTEMVNPPQEVYFLIGIDILSHSKIESIEKCYSGDEVDQWEAVVSDLMRECVVDVVEIKRVD